MNALYTRTVDANLDNVFGAWVFNSYEFQNIKDNPEKVKARLAQFTPGIQAHPMLKKSQDASQATARSAVGQPYTDFSCKNTAGETIALSSLTGPGRWVLARLLGHMVYALHERSAPPEESLRNLSRQRL